MTKTQRQRLLDKAAIESNLWFAASKKAMEDSYYEHERRERLHRLTAMEELLELVGITVDDIHARGLEIELEEAA